MSFVRIPPTFPRPNLAGIGKQKFLLGLVAVCALGGGPMSLAQEAESLFSLTGLTAEEAVERRNAAYENLAVEAAYFQRQAAVIKAAARVVGPSVVHIEATGERRRASIEEAGSGVIVQRGGKKLVLTNRHVVKIALPDNGASSKYGANSRIRIELDDHRVLRPTALWADAQSDVCAMEVEGDDLLPARIGDSSELGPGDFVLAFGSPFALSQSVTFGIVSALGRRDLSLEEEVAIQDFIQVDAAINPGNSGGPLVNLLGEVVGINTAIASNSGANEGIGFTIPINMAMSLVDRLIADGQVVRGFLGVKLDANFGQSKAQSLGLLAPQGACVVYVTPDSPAEAAGFRAEDVVLRFDGVDVEDDRHLITLTGLAVVGRPVDVLLWRDGELREVQVTIAPRASD